MNLKKVLCFSVGIRIFVVIIGMGLIFFRCLKSDNQAVAVVIVPMLEAAAAGQYERIKELLHNGESPNVVDADGNSPLNFAVWNGIYPANRPCIELLLQHQAHPRQRNKGGQDALHQVLKLDYKDLRMQILGKLIKFGGNINDKDLKSFTVLEKIVETYDTISVDMILDWWGKLINPDVLRSAKARAVQYNLADVLVVLNKKRVMTPAIQDPYWEPSKIDPRTGMSDVHYAVINNSTKIIDASLARRASIDQPSKDEYGMRPLHYAVLHQHPDMVEYLLEKKANVNSTNIQGNTALHLVAWIDSQENAKKIADILLKHSAALNAKNKDGNTLLHILIYDDNKDLIEYIGKQHDFDLYTKNNDRESALDLAARLKREYLLANIKRK